MVRPSQGEGHDPQSYLCAVSAGPCSAACARARARSTLSYIPRD